VIKMVIGFQNDMVMVFDAHGEQIPEYQGQYGDVRGSILRDAPAGTVFAYWLNHSTKPHTVLREKW